MANIADKKEGRRRSDPKTSTHVCRHERWLARCKLADENAERRTKRTSKQQLEVLAERLQKLGIERETFPRASDRERTRLEAQIAATSA